jgi:hypothetical protein
MLAILQERKNKAKKAVLHTKNTFFGLKKSCLTLPSLLIISGGLRSFLMSLTHCTRFSASEVESCTSQENLFKLVDSDSRLHDELHTSEGERRHIWCYTFP